MRRSLVRENYRPCPVLPIRSRREKTIKTRPASRFDCLLDSYCRKKISYQTYGITDKVSQIETTGNALRVVCRKFPFIYFSSAVLEGGTAVSAATKVVAGRGGRRGRAGEVPSDWSLGQAMAAPVAVPPTKTQPQSQTLRCSVAQTLQSRLRSKIKQYDPVSLFLDEIAWG